MRVLHIPTFGGPEVLRVDERADPQPGPGEVRVRVAYAGVNRADLIQRTGHYPAPPGAPQDVPGLEYAGVVDAIGLGCKRRRVGQRVYGLVPGGAQASSLVVAEDETALVPEELGLDTAAALPEVFITAHDALFARGRLRSGETLLIHAIASGVGTAALQLARRCGARVLGTTRTSAKAQACRELGADAVLVPDAGQFAEAVREESEGRGADVVLDLVGGSTLPESIRACAPRARLVLVGLTAGSKAELDLRLVLQKRLELIGTVLRSRPHPEKVEAARLLEVDLSPAFASGALRATIARTFDLEEAADAHRLLESNAVVGKVLLKVDPSVELRGS